MKIKISAYIGTLDRMSKDDKHISREARRLQFSDDIHFAGYGMEMLKRVSTPVQTYRDRVVKQLQAKVLKLRKYQTLLVDGTYEVSLEDLEEISGHIILEGS